MSQAIASNLPEAIKASAGNVFETMLSMKIEVTEGEGGSFPPGKQILGTIGFAGEQVIGTLHIHLTEQLARAITAGMLGMTVEEVTDLTQVNDVIGELSNMICGDFKNNLGELGNSCKLGLPSITHGEGIQVGKGDPESQTASVGFAYKEHKFFVNVQLKATQP